MSRPRHFTKAEILDAARAAAETGLSACLYPTGEIEFTHGAVRRQSTPGYLKKKKSPEELLADWVHEDEVSGRA